MNKRTEFLGFVVTGLLIGLAAKFIPHTPIDIVPPGGVQISESQPSSISTNTTELLRQYKSRLLFTSKSAIDTELITDIPQTSIVEDWSPLDYQLVGISSSGSRKTGWFKHVETGELISAKKGMQLGSWTLEYLSSTEARLSLGREVESLKLFQGLEPH